MGPNGEKRYKKGNVAALIHAVWTLRRLSLVPMDTTDAPQIIEHVHESLTFTPYDTKWIPLSARPVINQFCGCTHKMSATIPRPSSRRIRSPGLTMRPH